jgi:hypothetical protein
LRRLRADSGLAGFARWVILLSGRSIGNARYGKMAHVARSDVQAL